MLADDGTANIESSPYCAVNSFEFSPAVSSQAVVYLDIFDISVPIYESGSVTSLLTITPPQLYRVWFSDTNGNTTQELVLDYTGLRSLIVSYSSSGWALTGPNTYNLGKESFHPCIRHGTDVVTLRWNIWHIQD